MPLLPSPDAMSMYTMDRERLWGILPREKLVFLGGLERLQGPEPALSSAFRTALVEENPWLRALRPLGYDPRPDQRAVPIEEGETSLNLNAYQVLAALLPLLEGGPAVTVVGSMAAGNHGLLHALERQAASFPGSRTSREALLGCFGDAALADAGALLEGGSRRLARGFARLPLAVRRVRALRLPSGRLTAPDAESLAALFASLRLHPDLGAELLRVREAQSAAGLTTAADLMILVRTWLLRRLAEILGRGEVCHLPTSFEHLVVRGTGEAFPSLTLGELAADYHAVFRASPAGAGRPGQRVWSGLYRVLNHYDPVDLLTTARRRAGRAARHGWRVLRASYAGGRVRTDRDSAPLLSLTVAELLGRGYGFSGKLVYMAMRAVNGGRVCNQILRSRPDVFAPLADPGHPSLVMPLGMTTLYGNWQLRSSPQLDLLALVDWLYRCRRPERDLRRLLEAFREGVADPTAPDASLVLERPGAFTHL